jgi:uncharacterized protein
MPGESDLKNILKKIKPVRHSGEYVFCSVSDARLPDFTQVISLFKEGEGTTIILSKITADELKLSYSFEAVWITLSVHSSLEAVGLTAAFSRALAEAGISCNVVAAYFHDHIFVNRKDAQRAMTVLESLTYRE